MNGAQDLGGQHGFGRVEHDDDHENFHHRWEERAFALTLVMGFLGLWNIDRARHARESLPPAQYLSSSYYQIWAEGLIRLMLDEGLVVAGELTSGKLVMPARDLDRKKVPASAVAGILARGGPSSRPLEAAPAFKVGDKVTAIRMNPAHHTRLPRYLRGCPGEIVMHHGGHVFPDSNAHGKGENPQHLYTVRFAARAVWGKDANPNDQLHADLWESYLAAA